MAIPIDKKKVDAINAKINTTPKIEPTTSWNTINNKTVAPNEMNIQDQLKTKIATGDFSASEARQYNQLTWNQNWAREVAITSPEALQSGNLKTTISQPEALLMKETGMTSATPISSWIKAEQPTPTETKTIETPEWTKTETKTTNQPQIDQTKMEDFNKDYQEMKKKWLDDMAIRNATASKYWADSEQLKLINTYQQWQLQNQIDKNPENIYNTLKTWWIIANNEVINSPEYQKAKTKFWLYNKYINASADSLYGAFVNWDIPSDMQQDLSLNTNFAVAKDKYNKKVSADNTNTEMSNMYNITSWKETTQKIDKSQELSNKMYDLFSWMWKTDDELITLRDYMAENYPDIVAQTQEQNSKVKQKKEIESIIDNRLKELKKQYPWMTTWSLMVLASQQNEDLYNQVKTLQNDISELSSNVQFQTILAEKEYSSLEKQKEKEAQIEQEKRWYMFNYLQWEQNYQRWLEAETRQRDYQLEDIKTQQDFTTQQSDTQFNRSLYTQELQNKYQDSKDIQNYNQDLQKMWISNAMAIDMNNLNFKQQKELNAINQKYNQSQDVQNYNRDIAKMKYSNDLWTQTTKDLETFKYNLENWIDPTTPINLYNAPDWTVIKGKYWVSETMSQPWMQCWEYINKITWLWLWDTLQSKLNKMTNKATNSYETVDWEVWDVAVWVPNPTDKTFAKYWHTWIITKDLWDSWEIKSSNINWDWAISTDVVPKQKIMWTTWNYDKTKLIEWDKWETTWLTETLKYASTLAPTERTKYLKENNLEKEYINYKSKNVDENVLIKYQSKFDSLPQVKDWNSAQWVQEWLNINKNTDLSWPDIQWLISNYAKILDPTSVVRETEYALAKQWASQWAIDKAKQQIATFIAWWSNALSSEAQKILKTAMQNRLNSMQTAYKTIAKQEVKRANAWWIPLTYEQLTWEKEQTTWNIPTNTTWNTIKSESWNTYTY